MNIKLSFLALTLAMLACMTTVEPYATYPADPAPTGTATGGAVQTEEPFSGAVYEPIAESQALKACAVVTASEALHLRAEPTEKSRVLAYLMSGQQVEIITATGAWWKVRAEQTGWAKAEYLREEECQ